jgi:hypothetical protein
MLRKFGAFWWDFVVGDEWRFALIVAIATALGVLTALDKARKRHGQVRELARHAARAAWALARADRGAPLGGHRRGIRAHPRPAIVGRARGRDRAQELRGAARGSDHRRVASVPVRAASAVSVGTGGAGTRLFQDSAVGKDRLATNRRLDVRGDRQAVERGRRGDRARWCAVVARDRSEDRRARRARHLSCKRVAAWRPPGSRAQGAPRAVS